MTVSYKQHQQTLSRLLKEQHLPHALVISSANHDEKQSFANWLSTLLICSEPILENDTLSACQQCKSCYLLASSGHPDHLLINEEERFISVDLIRRLTTFFEKTALIGERQVALVLNAEKMTESAANALLKTLEEPTNNSFIILTTSDVERLLPTIRSRCRTIELRQSILDENYQQNSVRHPVVSDEQRRCNDAFISFLSEPRARQEFLQIMIASAESLNWCELLIINLMRSSVNWLNLVEFTKLDQHKLERLQQLSHDDIWSIYQIICRHKKQQITLTQVNRQFLLEKLTAELALFLSKKSYS
ncbi:hypothetical protein [Thalassotalea ganghwensis]